MRLKRYPIYSWLPLGMLSAVPVLCLSSGAVAGSGNANQHQGVQVTTSSNVRLIDRTITGTVTDEKEKAYPV